MFDFSEMNRKLCLQPAYSRIIWDNATPDPDQLEFLYDQTELTSGVAYIASFTDAEAFFADHTPTVCPGSLLFLAGWHETALIFPEDLSVLAYPVPLGALYNHLSSYLRELNDTENPQQQFSRFWSQVVSNEELTGEDIRGMLNRLPDAQTPFVQICSVAFDSPHGCTPPYQQVMSQILSILPHSFGTIRDNEIIILITYQERHFDYPYDFDRLTIVLEQYNAYLGISNGTRDLYALPMLHTLIRHTVRLALQIQVAQETRIFTFERLGMYLTIDLAARGFRAVTNTEGLMYLAHPAITLLTRYDEENGSNLRMTLYFYLLSDKSVAEAAKLLQMHRNTVMYKLKKINELCALDLNDPNLCERLLFSCQLARYYEEINRTRSIRPTENW